jgi:hypothetical protein
MVHEEIEAQNLAERYVMGKLSADELDRFEEHFVDCPRCQDSLEAAERLRAALRSVPPEPAPVLPAGPALPVRRVGWPRTAWLIAAGFVIAAGVSAILAVRLARMGQDLEKVRIASLDWRHRYEAASGALRPPAANQPVVGPTFYLSTTRGGEPDAASGTRVDVPGNAGWVILALDREFEPGTQSLRASLKDFSGKEVWQQSGLPAGSRRPLSIVVPSELLAGGRYILTIEALSSDGRYQAEGVYQFQATKR